jgi:hypothetical protein
MMKLHPTMRPVSEDEDMYTIDDFVKMCKNRSFIDYDGMGNWATSTHVDANKSEIPWIYPSGVAAMLPEEIQQKKDEGYTHVAWYNR